MNKFIFLLLTLVYSVGSRASAVDTVSIYSNSMKKDYKCVVITPSIVQDEVRPLPVVYLLHGYSGWYANWLLRVPELKNCADLYSMIIVCPDGGFSSWYLDSPVDPNIRFETYISKEVPEYIDNHYPTIRGRKGRAITGLSMGGHGGLWLGFRHADTFGACGSMSGGVELRPFLRNWDLALRLGDTLSHADNWINYSVSKAVETKPADSLAILIDCGTEDFFYGVNHALHEKMLGLHISHDYIERPGRHDWAYWRNAVQYQLLFFSNYFRGSR